MGWDSFIYTRWCPTKDECRLLEAVGFTELLSHLLNSAFRSQESSFVSLIRNWVKTRTLVLPDLPKVEDGQKDRIESFLTQKGIEKAMNEVWRSQLQILNKVEFGLLVSDFAQIAYPVFSQVSRIPALTNFVTFITGKAQTVKAWKIRQITFAHSSTLCSQATSLFGKSVKKIFKKILKN